MHYALSDLWAEEEKGGGASGDDGVSDVVAAGFCEVFAHDSDGESGRVDAEEVGKSRVRTFSKASGTQKEKELARGSEELGGATAEVAKVEGGVTRLRQWLLFRAEVLH